MSPQPQLQPFPQPRHQNPQTQSSPIWQPHAGQPMMSTPIPYGNYVLAYILVLTLWISVIKNSGWWITLAMTWTTYFLISFFQQTYDIQVSHEKNLAYQIAKEERERKVVVMIPSTDSGGEDGVREYGDNRAPESAKVWEITRKRGYKGVVREVEREKIMGGEEREQR